MKRNYGGRVIYVPGKERPPAGNMLGSAMDRYDIMMVGDVTAQTRRNKKTGADEVIEVGMLKRVAYAPSIGSTEERAQRLQDLLAGRSPQPTRRAQPELPDAPDQNLPPAQPVARVGQNIRPPKKGAED